MNELLEVLSEVCPDIDFSRKDLISAGLVDSLAFVKIISAIQDKLNVEIDISLIEPDNFESLENIWKLINNLK